MPSSPCWPCTRPHGPVPSDPRLALGPELLGNNPERQRLVGLKIKRSPGTGSMTCAGISSLVIASNIINSPAPRSNWRPDRLLQATGEAGTTGDPTGPGMARATILGENNPTTAAASGYSTISTAWNGSAGMTAQRFIGGPRLVPRGAEHLVRTRQRHACRASGGAAAFEDDPRIATSFAVLFLAKGRRPMLLAKLKHGAGRRLEPAPQRHRQPDPLRRGAMEAGIHLADRRSADGQRRGPAPGAGPVLLAATKPAAAETRSSKARARSSAITSTAAASSCRGRLRRGRLRRGLPTARCGWSFRAGVSPEAAARRSTRSGMPRNGSTRSGAAAVGDRVRLPHQRRLCPPDPPRIRGHRSRACGSCRAAGREREVSAAPVQAQIHAGLSSGINVLAYATNRELNYKYDWNRLPRPSRRRAFGPRRAYWWPACVTRRDATSQARALTNLFNAAAAELKIRVNTKSREITIRPTSSCSTTTWSSCTVATP